MKAVVSTNTNTIKKGILSALSLAVAKKRGPTSTCTAMKGSSAASFSSCTHSNSSYQHRISKLASQIEPRILISTHGSGNYGESGTASFYVIDKLPSVLTTSSSSSENKHEELKRVDINLGGDDDNPDDHIAFYIDNVLTHQEADALASCAESILEHNGHSRLAPGIRTPPGMRVNEAAHWFPSRNEASTFMGSIFDRIHHLVPQTLDGGNLKLHGRLSEKVAQFKYNKGDEFKRHVDGLFLGQGINANEDDIEEWDGIVSGISMLFYLNDHEHDGLKGGETRLWNKETNEYIDISPRKGRVLFFRRGSPHAVHHAGRPITGDVPKYMALINLVYETRENNL